MGSHPYCYFTPYREDIGEALQVLRQLEFAAGHYDPALQSASPPVYTFQLRFPPGDHWPSPGAQHTTIEKALGAGEAEGTGSILDIMRISGQPDFCSASPVAHSDLVELFGAIEPTKEAVNLTFLETNGNGWGYLEFIPRGQARYILVFKDNKPDEIFFLGFSFD